MSSKLCFVSENNKHSENFKISKKKISATQEKMFVVHQIIIIIIHTAIQKERTVWGHDTPNVVVAQYSGDVDVRDGYMACFAARCILVACKCNWKNL